MSGSLFLPAGGELWQVTSPGWVRWLRQRTGGDVRVPIPDGGRAAEVAASDVDEVVRDAPAALRELWRMTEASGPAWGWTLWRLGDPARPDGWNLTVDSPAGAVQRYTWVRKGDGMELAAWAETGAAPEPIAG